MLAAGLGPGAAAVSGAGCHMAAPGQRRLVAWSWGQLDWDYLVLECSAGLYQQNRWNSGSHQLETLKGLWEKRKDKRRLKLSEDKE